VGDAAVIALERALYGLELEPRCPTCGLEHGPATPCVRLALCAGCGFVRFMPAWIPVGARLRCPVCRIRSIVVVLVTA
jgi:hypothetical protein